MLRISYSLTNHVQRWTLCGQLAGAWVQELRSCWEHSRQAANASGSVIDLSDVTFVDESGERLLSEMRGAGVRFVATGIDTKHLIENLKTKGEKTLRRLI
jgi:anti-anti-sigma regulatory factor